MSTRIENTPRVQAGPDAALGSQQRSQLGDTTVAHAGEDTPPPTGTEPSNAGRMAAFGGTAAVAGGLLLAAASGPLGFIPLAAMATGAVVGAVGGLVTEQVTRHKVPFARTSASAERRGTNPKAAPRTSAGKGSRILAGIGLSGTSPREYQHRSTDNL